MNGLTRKTLLLRSADGARPEKLSRSFAVLKCETSGNNTVFELNEIVGNDKDKSNFRLFVYNGTESLSVGLPAETYPLNKFYSTENGLCAAVVEETEKGAEILLFGNTLKEKITVNEVLKIYEKNHQKNDDELKNAQKRVLFQEKDGGTAPAENQKRELTDLAATANLTEPMSTDNADEAVYARDYTEIIPLDNDDSDDLADPHDSASVLSYDDEAVASVDYYEIERNIGAKADETTDPKTTASARENSTARAPIKENYDEISDTTSYARKNEQTEREQAENGKQAYEHEEDLRACPFQRKQPAFYDEKRGEIERLFDKYPPISSLSRYIPESRWVRIEYKKDGHYIVGTIKKDDVMQYIVYGVPGMRNSRPRGFDRYSVFLPESLFSSSGKGYWCTFQDAETGKIESPE